MSKGKLVGLTRSRASRRGWVTRRQNARDEAGIGRPGKLHCYRPSASEQEGNGVDERLEELLRQSIMCAKKAKEAKEERERRRE